ncbi:hypothetical protein AAVH_03708 [Aphelenchoides avenae]|nr:hypothetical protein AAVH_03708 [Aphelenchus avenae]
MERASLNKPPGATGARSSIRAGRALLSPEQYKAYFGIEETLSVASLTLNDATNKTALERSALTEVAQPSQTAKPASHSAERSVTQNRNEVTRPDSGGSQDFNPVTDKTPPINLNVDCSAFDASRQSSGTSMGTATSTHNEYASPDSGGSEDFNPVTDEAPHINMDVNCSAFDATRRPSRSTVGTAPSTQCSDETAHHTQDEQDQADSVADHGHAQEMAYRGTAAANLRQSVAQPSLAQGHELPQNSTTEHTRPDSGGSQDFNPVKDKAPPINLSVDCSAFDASPRPSGSSMGTTTSTQNDPSPDIGGSDDFNPVTDEAPQINLDVNCSPRPPSAPTKLHIIRETCKIQLTVLLTMTSHKKCLIAALPLPTCVSLWHTPSFAQGHDLPQNSMNDHTSEDDGGLKDFNPVTDEAPTINMDVNCSAFEATRRQSRFAVDTAPSSQCDDESAYHAQDQQEQADSVADFGLARAAHRGTSTANLRQSAAYRSQSHDHSLPQNSKECKIFRRIIRVSMAALCRTLILVTDEAPTMNMDVNCTVFEATRRSSCLIVDTAPPTHCGDEPAHHAQQEQAGSVADLELAQAAHRGAAAAKTRQSVAYPPFSQGHDLPPNSKLSQVESKTAQVRKSYVGGPGGHARCSVFAHRQQRFEGRTPSPTSSLSKNLIPLRSALRPSRIVPFKKPGQIVGGDDKIPGPHRDLRLAKNSAALRNIADNYDSNSSSSGGAPVRKTVSLQDTRADRGYVRSPGQNAVTVDDNRLNVLRKKSKRKSVDLQRVVLQRNLQDKAASMYKSPTPSAGSSLLMDLSTISKSGFTNRTRKPVFPPLPQHWKEVAKREKGRPQLRFPNDTSYEENSSEGDRVEQTLPPRPADDLLDTSRSRPRLVDYASSASYETSLETTDHSAGFCGTSSYERHTTGRSTTQSHDEIEHGRRRTNDPLREQDIAAPSQTLLQDDNGAFDFVGASPISFAGPKRDSDWGDRPASQNRLGGYPRTFVNSPADFNNVGPSPVISRRRRSSLDHSIFTTGGSDTSGMWDTPGNASALNTTSTPLRAPLSSLPRRRRSLSPSIGSRDSGVSAASSSSPVHVVANRGRPEQIKLLTPKIRGYTLRKDNVVNGGGRNDVQAQTDNGVPLRRSTRNRIPRLNQHLGQRARYEKGDPLTLVGVASVVVNDPRLVKARTVDPAEAHEKIKKQGAKRAQVKRNDKPAPKKKRGLDANVTVDDD